MRAFAETIVACITGPGPGAVAWVRLSGPEAWRIAGEVFRPWHPEPRMAQYGRYANGDDGLALPFLAGHSYTGEESVELSMHGSPVSVRDVILACERAGARLARPGEFTERAFMNGRLDLSQAEAVRETVEAQSHAQLRSANLARDGVLRSKINQLREQLIFVLAAIEASVDFSEEVGELDREAAGRAITEALRSLDLLIGSQRAGRIVRDGVSVAILGLPNAGKSSLLNALLGADRAIVTEIAGTTRDTIEEACEIAGHWVRFIDTAGLRETEDRVESIGIERALHAAQNADLALYVFDAARGWTDDDERWRSGLAVPTMELANKSDLAHTERGTPISCLHGEGCEAIEAWIAGQLPGLPESPLANPRQIGEMERARGAAQLALETLASDLPEDLAAVGLQDAIAALGRITGETADADLLGEVFRRFCIGK